MMDDSVTISIMGISLEIEYTFTDQALEWQLETKSTDSSLPPEVINEQKCLELFLRMHCSERIECYLRNVRHWHDFGSRCIDPHFPDEDTPPYF